MKKTSILFILIFITLHFSKAQKPIPPQKVLRNNYVIELNKQIDFINWQTERIYVLIKELTDYKENPRESQIMAKGSYIDINRAKHLQDGDSTMLELGVDVLPQNKALNTKIINKIGQLREQAQLIYHFYSKGYFKNDKEKGRQLILEYQEILNTVYQLRGEIFEELPIKNINDFDQSNPWTRTGSAMLAVLKQGEIVMQSFYNRKNNMLSDTSDLSLLRSQLNEYWNAKEENLEGLILEPYRSNNPDYAYKWINITTKRVLLNYKKLDYFSPRINHGFNDMIEHYNDLVKMALDENFNLETHPRYFQGVVDTLRPVYLPYYLNGVSLLPSWDKNSNELLTSVVNPSLEGFKFNNLVFVLDISGSMAQDEKLTSVKESMIKLVEVMRPDDEITIVTYAGEARKVLKPTSAKKHKKIKRKLNKLEAGGFTNLYEGMKLAYSMAEQNFKDVGNNRLILVTDGAVRSSRHLQEMVSNYADQNISLSLLTFENEKDQSLVELAAQSSAFLNKIDHESTFSALLTEAKRAGFQ